MKAAKIIDFTKIRAELELAKQVRPVEPETVIEMFHEARMLRKEVEGFESKAKGLVKKMELQAGQYGDVELKITHVESKTPSIDFTIAMSVLTPREVKKLEDAGAFKFRASYDTYTTEKK